MRTVPLRSCQKLVNFFADGTSANAVPDQDENDGEDENQRRNRVDLRSNSAAKTSPYFEWKSIVAADEEKADGNLIHGEGENEQTGGDERKFEIRKRDAPERLPGRGAEIEGGF